MTLSPRLSMVKPLAPPENELQLGTRVPHRLGLNAKNLWDARLRNR